MEASPLFSVPNLKPDSGTPPTVDWAAARYRGYFENEQGDQWLLWWDDLGVHLSTGVHQWEQVELPLEEIRAGGVRLGLILTDGEREWLRECLALIQELASPPAI